MGGGACRFVGSYIYFLSAKHVLQTIADAPSELTFFDGTRITVQTEAVFPKDSRSDLSMFRIRTQYVPVDTLLALREISFEKEYYEELSVGEKVFLYAAWWYQEEDLIGETVFQGFDAEDASRGFYDNEKYLVFERCSKEGQSGCPVFDDRGRCLALSSSYYYSMLEDQIVYEVDCYCRLDQAEELLDFFKKQ